jgi:hypothetical protein
VGKIIPGHEQPLGPTENRADEWPVFSSLPTYRVSHLMALAAFFGRSKIADGVIKFGRVECSVLEHESALSINYNGR